MPIGNPSRVIKKATSIYDVVLSGIRLSPGSKIYYVSKDGDDSNDGKEWHTAKLTVDAGINLLSSGDILLVDSGTYDESANGVSGAIADVNNIHIIGVGDVEVRNTDTTNGGRAFTITADYVTLHNMVINKGETTSTGSHCIYYDGASWLQLYDCQLAIGKAGFSGLFATGGANAFGMAKGPNQHSAIYSLVAAGIGINFNNACYCAVTETVIGGLDTGVLFGGSSFNNVIYKDSTISNCDIGIDLQSGTQYNTIHALVANCSTANIQDNSGNETNSFEGSLTYIKEQLDYLLPSLGHHEHVYPEADGEGTSNGPITVNTNAADETHAAGTDKDYWGEPIEILAPNTITSQFSLLGAYVYGNTTGKFTQINLYKIVPDYSSAKSGGNDWDEGETVLTVADGSIFQVGDLVYITSSAKGGEIVRVTNVSTNVVTIERETTDCGCTGLRWNHTTAGTSEKMWLCYRNECEWHGNQFDFSCASARDFVRYTFNAQLLQQANSGIICRAVNATDSLTVSFNMKLIRGEIG